MVWLPSWLLMGITLPSLVNKHQKCMSTPNLKITIPPYEWGVYELSSCRCCLMEQSPFASITNQVFRCSIIVPVSSTRLARPYKFINNMCSSLAVSNKWTECAVYFNSCQTFCYYHNNCKSVTCQIVTVSDLIQWMTCQECTHLPSLSLSLSCLSLFSSVQSLPERRQKRCTLAQARWSPWGPCRERNRKVSVILITNK